MYNSGCVCVLNLDRIMIKIDHTPIGNENKKFISRYCGAYGKMNYSKRTICDISSYEATAKGRE